jgi:hypothetical protein
VPVANDQAVALVVATFLVLVEKLLHLGLDGLLEYLSSTTAHQLIEQSAPRELLAEVGDFQVNGTHPWHSVLDSLSLAHGVSFQPSLGQLRKRNQTSISRIRRLFSLS